MARQFSTVIEFIQYGKVNSNTFGAGVIEFEGFNSIGDGGATLWQREGTTGLTPSKTPTEFDDNRFTDAVGDLWVLVPSQIITFNGVQFLPSPFGDAGNGGYYFNGAEFVFLASAADEAAAAAASAAAAQVSAQRAEDAAASIEGQLTTAQLIASSLTLDVGDTIQTNGFYTAGDGGGALWVKTASTDDPSQTPVDMGATSDGLAQFTDASGDVWRLVGGYNINPLSVGAHNSDVNSSDYLSLCFDMMRNKINSTGFQVASVTLDGGNNTFYAYDSINATKLIGWNYNIQNISIYGKCSGQSVLDFTGSRGGKASNVSIYGDISNMPTTGIQFARSSETGFGFCDNWTLENVTTVGYYSIAGGYFYAQETTHYDHCRFWNYNNEARGAIHIGNDSQEPYSSLYAIPVTGSRSFINNKYTNVDYRYLPIGDNFSAITSISKTNPAVVTTTSSHGFETGENVTLIVSGMGEVDNKSLTITKLSDTSFSLDGVDSTSYGTFTSGQAIKSQTKSTVLLGRCEQHTFDTSYIVAYGEPHLEVAFVDNNPIDQLKLDLLFEGAGMSSHIRFTGVGTTVRYVLGFEHETYNTHSNFSLISSDATTGSVTLNSGFVKINSEAKESLIPFASGNFTLNNIDVSIPSESLFNPLSLGAFSGKVSDHSGYVKYYGVDISGSETILYTPTIIPDSGSFGELNIAKAEYTLNSGIVNFDVVFSIVDIGTAAGSITFTVPIDSLSGAQLATGAELVRGSLLIVRQVINEGTMRLLKYDGTTDFTTGDFISITGSYSV